MAFWMLFETAMTIPRALHFTSLAVLLLTIPVSMAAPGDDGDTVRHQAFLRAGAGESHLIAAVRHELLMLPSYGVFDDLSFRVEPDGTVRLMGAVVRGALKIEAEAALKAVEGVHPVVNQIEVLPRSPGDDGIRFAEYRAIYGDAVLSMRYGFRSLAPIHIIVRGGNVILEGSVAGQADKDLIFLRANSVAGVLSVTNNLLVDGSAER